MNILENSIIEWLPVEEGMDSATRERVLWCGPEKEYFYTINIVLPKALPTLRTYEELSAAVSADRVIRRYDDPYAAKRNPHEEFLARYKKELEITWGIISEILTMEPAIYDPVERGKLVKTLLGKASKPAIYKWLWKYWVAGKFKYALLPDYQNCGAPNTLRLNSDTGIKRGRPSQLSKLDPEWAGINIDAGIKAIFLRAYKIFYETSAKKPLNAAFDKMLEEHFSRNDASGNIILLPPHQAPTFEQFRYHYQLAQDLEKALINRNGNRNFNLKSRPRLYGSTGLSFGPGSLYQIDATIADVYLVSRVNRLLIIGRPVVYFCLDLFSRMIVGLHVALEGPSWTTGMMALANSFMDKVEYCARFGIAITPEQWPVYGIPRKITADRGEFMGMQSDLLVCNMNVTLANCPPYRADWKGLVEQTFHRANEKCIHWMPGAVRKRTFGQPDPRFEAKLDIFQFTQILIQMILHHNLFHRLDTRTYPLDRDLMADGVEPIPIELWQWGIENRSGILREATDKMIMLSLMPRDKARITRDGIIFKNMTYISTSEKHRQWFLKAGQKRSWTVDVAYDPRSMETIYFLDAYDGVVPFVRVEGNDHNRRFKDLWYEEILECQALDRLGDTLHRPIKMQSKASFNQVFDDIVTEATQMTNNAIATNTGGHTRVTGEHIRANRALENETLRSDEGWKLCESSGAPLASPDVDQEDIEEPPLQNRRLSILEQIKSLDSKTD